ncbi:unnamed protein product [Clavelina lepadiformis]|uniref:Uncharacterized protein n=1 Tax=Clavelina lepadiformis TaxID=159417 RepID=A0ABP0FAP7_CLALP
MDEQKTSTVDRKDLNGLDPLAPRSAPSDVSASDLVTKKLEDKRRQLRKQRSHSRRILHRGLSVSSAASRLDSVGSVFSDEQISFVEDKKVRKKRSMSRSISASSADSFSSGTLSTINL